MSQHDPQADVSVPGQAHCHAGPPAAPQGGALAVGRARRGGRDARGSPAPVRPPTLRRVALEELQQMLVEVVGELEETWERRN